MPRLSSLLHKIIVNRCCNCLGGNNKYIPPSTISSCFIIVWILCGDTGFGRHFRQALRRKGGQDDCPLRHWRRWKKPQRPQWRPGQSPWQIFRVCGSAPEVDKVTTSCAASDENLVEIILLPRWIKKTKRFYKLYGNSVEWFPLHWRHNDHDGVPNHQSHGCLLNRLFRLRSKKTSKLRVTGLCVGNSPGPVNSPHKGPVTRKMFPFDDVIMHRLVYIVKWNCHCPLTGNVYEYDFTNFRNSTKQARDPFLITLMRVWISNHMLSTVRHGITSRYPNVNGEIVRLGKDNTFEPTFHNGCYYLSMRW